MKKTGEKGWKQTNKTRYPLRDKNKSDSWHLNRINGSQKTVERYLQERVSQWEKGQVTTRANDSKS